MSVTVKKQKKAKNDWFICTLKCSKQYTREVFFRGSNKKSKDTVFRGFEARGKVDGWWIFKLNYIQKGTGESFSVIKH